MATDDVHFTFEPRWREEIVCTCERGAFVMEMTMGVDTVYIATKERWPELAPNWALDLWDTLYAQLAFWCKTNRIPLELDDRGYISEIKS